MRQLIDQLLRDARVGARALLRNRTFTAITAIKSSNVAQGIQQAQVSSNDNWAWYQAIRTRELTAATEGAARVWQQHGVATRSKQLSRGPHRPADCCR